MEFVIAVLVLVAGLLILGVAVDRVLRRRDRSDAAEAMRAKSAVPWTVGEISRARTAGEVFAGVGVAATLVVVRRVAEDGEELGRIVVATVPDNAPDWDAQMLEARSRGAQRAQILNGEP